MWMANESRSSMLSFAPLAEGEQDVTQRTTLGLDFGTSTTLIATREGDERVRIRPMTAATTWMATVAAVGETNRLIVGEAAENFPEKRIVRSVKSYLGSGTEVVRRMGVDGTDCDLSIDSIVSAILGEAVRRIGDVGLNFATVQVHMACPANWTGEIRGRLICCARDAGINLENSSGSGKLTPSVHLLAIG